MFKKNALLLFTGLFILSGVSALAATYDLKEMTPEVSRAIKERQLRFDEIRSLKSAGEIGENNRGYIEAVHANSNVEKVVTAENTNRRTIYKAVAEQNGLSRDGLAVVETVFSEVQEDKAHPGDYLRRSTGEWARKP